MSEDVYGHTGDTILVPRLSFCDSRKDHVNRNGRNDRWAPRLNIKIDRYTFSAAVWRCAFYRTVDRRNNVIPTTEVSDIATERFSQQSIIRARATCFRIFIIEWELW